VITNFSTDGDRGQGISSADIYLVVHKEMERSNKVWDSMFKGLSIGDITKEVLAYKLFLGAPDLLSVFVDNNVKVRMVCCYDLPYPFFISLPLS